MKLCGVLLAALVAAALLLGSPALSSPALSSPALAAGRPPSAAGALTIFRVDVSRYPTVGVVVTIPGARGAIRGRAGTGPAS